MSSMAFRSRQLSTSTRITCKKGHCRHPATRPKVSSKHSRVLIFVRSNNLRIDGYHNGDHVWKTHSFRELDWNSDPTLARDLSLTRSWLQLEKSNDYELFSPRPGKTIVLENIPKGFCTNSSHPVKSRMKLYISGKNFSFLKNSFD